MAKIITDIPAEDAFKEYAEALSNIIIDSDSPFTIGILGEWGTGKTSLMKNIISKLEHKKSNPPVIVWFDAWRCQQEKTFALIPLLGTIIHTIKKDEKLEKIVSALSNFLNSIELKCGLEGNMGLAKGSIGISNRDKKPDVTKLEEIESQYYDSLKKIENNLKNKKIVVFIDDLDRCRPDKVIEIIESFKVFLDIKGFVYVIAMSKDIVEKAIEEKYKDLEIKGDNYLEKIIQIPVLMPEWDNDEFKKYLKEITNEEGKEYAVLREYKDIISETITGTPRDIKRFINVYILGYELLKAEKTELDIEVHLILTIMRFKWNDFYNHIFKKENRKKLKKDFMANSNGQFGERLDKFKDNRNLSKFLNKNKKDDRIIDKITPLDDDKLSKYKKIIITVPKEINVTPNKETFIQLLKTGKVDEFNELRKEVKTVDLNEVDLSGLDLYEIDLSEAILTKSNLSESRLMDANLRNSYLPKTNLSGADLSNADLNGASLYCADLSRADLSGAYLNDADLTQVNLSGASLNGASLYNANLFEANFFMADLSSVELMDGMSGNLSGTILHNIDLSIMDLTKAVMLNVQEYSGLKVKNTNFKDAIINDKIFVEYLRKNGAKNVPEAIEDKNEIIRILKERNYPHIEQIKEFLK
ncbi:MAG: pentapeptide repeat-containing protein [Candidatus Aenigmarchaeota archaeon]|nr:pentapeptide repeat-containing protein [Candidatus Aenigmarchaeota archaeon]